MPLLVKARSFLRNLFFSRRGETDLDQEVHAHLELLIEENVRAGMAPKEAQRTARMGNWLHSVFCDCRYGLRQLRIPANCSPRFRRISNKELPRRAFASTTGRIVATLP